MDCHEGYMLVLSLGNGTYAKLVWVARTLFHLKSVILSPHFCHIQVEYYQPTTCNEDLIPHYIGWDTYHNF